MRARHWMLALAAMGAGAGATDAAAQQAPANPGAGDATRGRRLFVADGCYECHGTVGQGGPGVRLAPSPLPAAVIAAYIRNPAGEMPPYTSKVVSNVDVQDIYAYLATLPPPPRLANLPELNGG